MRLLPLLFLASALTAAEPEFPLTRDSLPQEGVPKGTMIKGTYTARPDSVFPGTVRDYQIYLPGGFDAAKPASFMVFQDGVIYQAPVVFDNLIAKKDIPPLVGVFIRPGVVPAANDNALPRFNRSYEYDSITETYSRFLIEEFLPAIEDEHKLKLSTDPNDAAIAGNSSGGICAFMVGWHRPDRFRRIFTGVGTYVGIHGADRLPVLVRKIEPKPLRVFLQSGTGDNNLYCGDWWMANQMMERSLTWAGYDVNHAWGEGGHNQKHASQVFPDAMRWLWRDWQTNKEVKANPMEESKWRGYEVVEGGGDWETAVIAASSRTLKSSADGTLLFESWEREKLVEMKVGAAATPMPLPGKHIQAFALFKGDIIGAVSRESETLAVLENLRTKRVIGEVKFEDAEERLEDMTFTQDGRCLMTIRSRWPSDTGHVAQLHEGKMQVLSSLNTGSRIALSPDQSLLYVTDSEAGCILTMTVAGSENAAPQPFFRTDPDWDGQYELGGLCVDTDGRLYVATSLGIQVCDQAGRMNFIIPTPKQPYDVCFGGKDLSELFIACGDTIYKRPTKVRGVVSGQQPPIKPAPPKL